MKKILVTILYILGGIVAFISIYFGVESILSSIPATSSNTLNDSEKTINIYLLSNGVHTDLVFPVKTEEHDWHQIFSPDHTLSKDSTKQWIAIGWGDKGFYLNTPEWKDLTAKTALIAALGIGETALHVTYYRQLSEDDHCYKIIVNKEQYRILIDYVRNSIEYTENEQAIYIETSAQYAQDDAFYEALGAYSLFYSCNTWTNNALKVANLPAAVWTVFDKGILRHYKK